MITSKQSETYKHIKKLHDKKYRDQTGQFLIYGKHLIDKAKEKHAIDDIYTSNPELEGIVISKALMKDLSVTETPYEQMAICHKEDYAYTTRRVVLLDDVQDPDNVGALIRSAVAFGFLKVILSPKCADKYNEKVIRASKGAIFDCEIIRMDLLEALDQLHQEGYFIIGADAHQKNQKIVEHEKIALVLGNEARGLSQEVKERLDHVYQIQTQTVESLNVSVAGAIMMYVFKEV